MHILLAEKRKHIYKGFRRIHKCRTYIDDQHYEYRDDDQHYEYRDDDQHYEYQDLSVQSTKIDYFNMIDYMNIPSDR